MALGLDGNALDRSVTSQKLLAERRAAGGQL
jgi:hypothetical protein